MIEIGGEKLLRSKPIKPFVTECFNYLGGITLNPKISRNVKVYFLFSSLGHKKKIEKKKKKKQFL